MDLHKFNQLKTLSDLKSSGYQSKPVREEMRDNLIQKLRKKEKVFEGIKAYDETVIPDLERAILSRHNILLLGLRGQAKTRIARLMTNLMDEYIPYIDGSELFDDPLNPISWFGHNVVKEKGD